MDAKSRTDLKDMDKTHEIFVNAALGIVKYCRRTPMNAMYIKKVSKNKKHVFTWFAYKHVILANQNQQPFIMFFYKVIHKKVTKVA